MYRHIHLHVYIMVYQIRVFSLSLTHAHTHKRIHTPMEAGFFGAAFLAAFFGIAAVIFEDSPLASCRHQRMQYKYPRTHAHN